MPEVQKRPSTSPKGRKAPASAKNKKPAARKASTAGRTRKRSASVIGSEGILIHTDEGFFYISEEEYKTRKLPRQGMGLAKVLIERGCIVANIPDNTGIVSGAYCYLLSIANLKKSTG
jgi:hypothetical protein